MHRESQHAGSAPLSVIIPAIVALVAMVAVHVDGLGRLNPLNQAISQYVFLPGGYLLVALGAVSLATLGVATAIRLARTAGASVALPVGLLGSFAVAMCLVGALPTDPTGTVHLDAAALVHRWAASYAFIVIPAVAIMVGRALARTAGGAVWARRLACCGVVVAALTGAFFAIHLPLMAMGSHIPAFGLLERAGFVIMVGVLTLLGLAARSLTRVPVDAPGAGTSAALSR